MALSQEPRDEPTSPIEVGVRDLRDNLSRYLELVSEGRAVIVTNHGKAVARLGPAADVTRFDQLVAEGVISPPRSSRRFIPNPSGPPVIVSDLLLEQRR